MTTAIIGTGCIGSQVARRIAGAGEKVLIAASNIESARQSVQQLG